MKNGVQETHNNQVITEKLNAAREKQDKEMQNVYFKKIFPMLRRLNEVCKENNFPYRFEMTGENDKIFPSPDGNIENQPLTEYDKTDLFGKNKSGKKLMDQIREFAYENNLPYYVSFAVSNDEEKTKYVVSSAIGMYDNMQLKNDMITRHQLVGIGAKVTPSISHSDDDDLNQILDRINSLEVLEDDSSFYYDDEDELDLKVERRK